MVTRGKRYAQAKELVEPDRSYSPQEAVELIKETSKAKFDETVELHMRTGSDPRPADQMVRGVASLPYGLGKQVRVLVFATGEAAEAAKQAGADYVGDEDLIKNIEGGWLEFEVGPAVPDMMSKIGRLGRILGRKGLMPNPRTGTMVQPRDLPRIIQESKKGRVEYRMDKTAIIHSPIGKVSFPPEHLLENMATIVEGVVKSKPAGIKGSFIRTAFLTSTMGPSIKLDVTTLQELKAEA